MKKTKAPGQTPSPASLGKTQKVDGDKNTALTVFAGAVLDISWQMAVVVLVPIIGGYELDKHFGTTPVLTIIGFGLAMLGTYAVLKHVLAEYSGQVLDKSGGQTMTGLLTNFAASAPQIYIAPSGLFHIGGLTITNSILYGWISTAVMVVLFIWVARRITVKPKGGIIQYIEVAADFIAGTVEGAFDEKKRAQKYVLYFVTLFFFLVMNNLLGLIPGVGDALNYHGSALLRPFTADFNATLAIAVVTMGLVYSSSVREVGIKDYFGHFFVGSLKNPFYLFLGLIEMITDITRVISLSLRLFLNISIVGIIVVVFAWLGHFLAPATAAPFFFLDLFDDMLQAFIFVLLATMYIAIAVNHASEHKPSGLTEEAIPETMDAKPEGARGSV